MNLYTERAANLRKTWFLMIGFFVLVIAVGFLLSQYFGSPYILYGAVAFSLLMNVGSYWFSDKLVLSMTHAKPATRAEYFDFYTITENLCIASGLPLPKLYVINDPAPNAFATGRNEKHAVVCVTTGLLSLMNRSELEGVIAHELSHIKNRDMLVMTVAVVLAGFLAILADLFLRVTMFGGDRDRNVHPAIMILAVVGIILAPFAAKLIQMAISRRREYLADSSGALMTRYPEGLASALEKIGSYSAPMRHTSHATAHLFIGNPFGQSAMGKLNNMFSTHPPVAERVKRLRAAA